MPSTIDESFAKFGLNDLMGPMDTVVNTDELILLILEALREGHESTVPRSGVSGSYCKCMLLNKQWCRWAQSFLWRHLSLPHIAFRAVLQQFDVEKAGTYVVTKEDRVLRRPREAYVRYCYYAAMIESVRNYETSKKEDIEFCEKLDLFDLKRNVFPRLKKVHMTVGKTGFWLPLCFRTHSITELSLFVPENAPQGIVRDISHHLPKLERLAITGLLHEADIDLLQVHRFIYVTSLSIEVDTNQVDNFIRIILFISHNLTDLALCFREATPLTVVRGGSSFNSLRTLKLDGLPSVSRSLAKLPTAPQLEALQLTLLSSDLSPEDCRAIEKYGQRSPFTRLLIDGTPFSRWENVVIDLLTLSELHRLSELNLILRSSASLLFPSPISCMLWQHLRTLTLVLGSDRFPLVTLHDFFCLASQAPCLKNATVRLDLRTERNPELVPQTHPDGAQYRSTSLRSINFSSSLLLDADQQFLFAILRELAPNIRPSVRMLESLYWTNDAMRLAVILYVRRMRPSTRELVVLLPTLSELAGTK